MSISRHVAPLVLGLSLIGSAASAAPVIWADWTSGTSGSSGTAAGNFPTTGITINYSGEIAFIQHTGGTNFWNPSAPYIGPNVSNAPPPSDIIALSATGSKTLTFSAPVDNLFFAVVSLNGNGYRFNEDFTIESGNGILGYWGSGTLTKSIVTIGPNTFYQLNGSGEPHGVIRFNRAVSTITWSSLTNEHWNGFTVGTYGAAPEPGTLAVLLTGVGFLGAAGWRRRRATH